ncbi:DUF5954 family protein [Streptomyces spectabilis]|uniref:DUF5954 family protein n=1 Tax=Streptomyces spectabilis TaxID=68270 RepID=UPI0021F2980F|nr:DUF5954 family protein [Streptomyces spectabilis]
MDDPGARRELLVAVPVLDREPVNELTVLGVCCRVVCREELARSGSGGVELPRPTETVLGSPSWEFAPTDPVGVLSGDG